MTDYIENKYKGNLGYIPNMKSGTEWSMEEVFGGKPPYDPSLFEQLCPRSKWLGKCIEDGVGFCTECGNLTTKQPNTHHKDCSCYLDAESYPVREPYLGGCPDCHQEGDDSLSIDSSRELGVSVISCSECDFNYSTEVCEEDLEELFKNKHK